MRTVATRLVLCASLVAVGAACRVGRSFGPPPVVPASVSLAVLPFAIEGDLDESGRFRPNAQPAGMPESLRDHAAQQLSSELAELGVSVQSPERVRLAAPPTGAAIYDVALAARVGRAVGADYVVMGAISRYVERVGTSLGVESPASVAYRIMLVDVHRAANAGTYRLDYTQAPLSNDIKQLPLWLQGKFGWMTRQEILDASFRQSARQIARTVADATSR
jgi:hypothetical protein